jgi:restriction system protein
VEAELPDRTVVPDERGFKYVRTRKEIDTQGRPEREVKQLYASVVAQTALRMLRECLTADGRELIDVVVFNGHVTTRDPATGQQVRPCLVSVSATRETFDGLELAHLDPVSCLKHLNALVSPHPYDLVAAPPVVDFDLAKFKFIDEFDAAAELDSRFDLLEMDPFKFEQLIRQLFEKIGMKSWVTQASRDDGIDGVAVHEDPIPGGVCCWPNTWASISASVWTGRRPEEEPNSATSARLRLARPQPVGALSGVHERCAGPRSMGG